MANFAPDWDVCERLQYQLIRTNNDGYRSIGLEAALDCFVSNASNGRNVGADELNRVASSARRGMRRRAALLERYYDATVSEDPRPTREAASTLSTLQQYSSPAEWELLVAVGEGESYAEMATRSGVTAQSLRVAVHRSRCRLAKMLD